MQTRESTASYNESDYSENAMDEKLKEDWDQAIMDLKLAASKINGSREIENLKKSIIGSLRR